MMIDPEQSNLLLHANKQIEILSVPEVHATHIESIVEV